MTKTRESELRVSVYKVIKLESLHRPVRVYIVVELSHQGFDVIRGENFSIREQHTKWNYVEY